MTSFKTAPKLLRTLLISFGLCLGVSAWGLSACADQTSGQTQEQPSEQTSMQKSVPDQLKKDMAPAGTADQKAKDENADEAKQASPDSENAMPEQAMPAPEAGQKAPTPDQETSGEVIAEPVASPKVEEAAPNGCYAQPDGQVACLCDSAEHCETLKQSDLCAPGTYWSGEGETGGCTQKTADKKEPTLK